MKPLTHLLFTIHLIIFLAFPALFFIPSSIWPKRIEYHFLLSSLIFLLFYAWGALWTIKFKDKLYGICFLDTITQRLRGFSMWDKRNYDHSFVEELSTRFNLVRVPKKSVPLLLLLCVILSATLYLMKLNGVILY